MSHVRIESFGKVVTDARVIYVDGDEETDISSCVSVADVHLGVGEVATVTLKAFVGTARVNAQIEDILLTHVKPPQRRSLWRRLRDVTTFGERTRRWA